MGTCFCKNMEQNGPLVLKWNQLFRVTEPLDRAYNLNNMYVIVKRAMQEYLK